MATSESNEVPQCVVWRCRIFLTFDERQNWYCYRLRQRLRQLRAESSEVDSNWLSIRLQHLLDDVCCVNASQIDAHAHSMLEGDKYTNSTNEMLLDQLQVQQTSETTSFDATQRNIDKATISENSVDDNQTLDIHGTVDLSAHKLSDDDGDSDDDRAIRADAASVRAHLLGDLLLDGDLDSGNDDVNDVKPFSINCEAPSSSFSSSSVSSTSISQLLALQLTSPSMSPSSSQLILPVAEQQVKGLLDDSGDVVDDSHPHVLNECDLANALVNHTNSIDNKRTSDAATVAVMSDRVESLSAINRGVSDLNNVPCADTASSAAQKQMTTIEQDSNNNGIYEAQYDNNDHNLFGDTDANATTPRVRVGSATHSRRALPQGASAAVQTPRARSSTSTSVNPQRVTIAARPRSAGRASAMRAVPPYTTSSSTVVPLVALPTTEPPKRASLQSARGSRPSTSTATTVTVSSAQAAAVKSIAVTPRRPPTSRNNNNSSQSQNNQNNNAPISWRELEEWRNVDLILSRKRRVVHAPSGGVETAKVPWGEEFAAIQSLKRFAVQHPDVLRAHIASQMDEVRAANRTSGARPSTRSRSSSSSSNNDARDALLLIKDLSFLLQQRLTPFLDVILSTVLPTVFSADKRFLCDIACEVLEALVTHCSGRRLALLLLQFGDASAQRDDVRLLNLTSVYVDKCFANLHASAIDALLTHASGRAIVTALAHLLVCKAAPSKIAAQKTLTHIHAALQDVAFARVVRSMLPDELASVVLQLTLSQSADSSDRRSPPKKQTSPLKAARPPSSSVRPQSLSILQRMVVQRQNRVGPAPE